MFLPKATFQSNAVLRLETATVLLAFAWLNEVCQVSLVLVAMSFVTRAIPHTAVVGVNDIQVVFHIRAWASPVFRSHLLKFEVNQWEDLAKEGDIRRLWPLGSGHSTEWCTHLPRNPNSSSSGPCWNTSHSWRYPKCTSRMLSGRTERASSSFSFCRIWGQSFGRRRNIRLPQEDQRCGDRWKAIHSPWAQCDLATAATSDLECPDAQRQESLGTAGALANMSWDFQMLAQTRLYMACQQWEQNSQGSCAHLRQT